MTDQMPRTTIQLPPELLEEAKVFAFHHKISLAALIREALIKYLKEG